ncbi:MAG: hypothetical protein GYA62_04735 [Bacteroidales bacterium]|nr:hypothetical protein [Bacteroidales bacterium]
MRKFLIIIVISFVSVSVFSQFHISFSSGYNIPFQKNNTWLPYQNLTYYEYYNINHDTTISGHYNLYKIDSNSKNLDIKFNTGLQYSIGINYIFKKYFGFDVQYIYNNDSISFFDNICKKNIGHFYERTDNTYYSDDTKLYMHVLNSITRRYQFGIIFQYPLKNNFVPYIKTSIGLNDTKIRIRSKPELYRYLNIVEQFYGKISKSYALTLGLKKTFKNIDLFAEAVYDLYSYSPVKGKITRSLNTNDIEFTNDSMLIENLANYPQYNCDFVFNSNKRIKPSLNLNTLSFNIGFQYKIPTSKDDFIWLKNNFISHLFFEFDKGYALAMDKKSLPMPYSNITTEYYDSKEPIYDPTWNSPGHLRYYIEKTVLKRKNNSMNFATGFTSSASIGYNFSKYFAAIFNYKYNNTTSDKHKKSTIATDVLFDSNFGMYVPEYSDYLFELDSLIFDFSSNNNSYYLMGMFQYPLLEKITPFIKLGLGISKHVIQINKKYKEYAYYSTGEIHIYSYKEKYYDSFSLSKQISLGAKFKIVNNLYLTSEAIFTFENYKPTKVFVYDYYDDSNTFQFDMDLVNDEYYANPSNSIYIDGRNIRDRYKNTFAMSTICFQLGIQYLIK